MFSCYLCVSIYIVYANNIHIYIYNLKSQIVTRLRVNNKGLLHCPSLFIILTLQKQLLSALLFFLLIMPSKFLSTIFIVLFSLSFRYSSINASSFDLADSHLFSFNRIIICLRPIFSQLFHHRL